MNIEKIGWYISTKPLPDLIAYDPDVQHDLTACSAKAAMFTIPLNRVTTDVESEYAYIEYLFTGFGASAIMCMSPLNYQSMYHKSLSITGYSCLVDDLPFDEFPGWDDPLTYSPVCRQWYKDQNALPRQNFFTKTYLFTNEPIIAISACAPFYKEDHPELDMYGAFCIDITPTDDLNKFFDLDMNNPEDNFFALTDDDPILISESYLQEIFGFKKDILDSSMSKLIQSSMDYIVYRESLAKKIEIKAD